jgi:hypothetical protein
MRKTCQNFIVIEDSTPTKKWNKGCVSHCGLAIYIKKYYYLKAKEELWKLKYFTMQKI